MKEETINIALATDENYKYFTGVTIFSLLEHISEQYQYAIYILSQQPTEDLKIFFTALGNGRKNVSFHFVDTKPWLDSIGTEKFYQERLSIAAYYRLFLPEILSEVPKIIYLDSDMIIQSDLSELFLLPQQYSLSAVRDKSSSLIPCTKSKLPFLFNARNTLNLKRYQEYFNSGMLVMNLQKMRTEHFVEQAKEKIISRFFYYHDQDILNVIYREKYNSLPVTWNDQFSPYRKKNLSSKILHFAGITPWKKEVDPLAALWWETARRTPFFDTMYRETEPLRNDYRKWLEGQYFALMRSHSWRVTSPLRAVAEIFRTFFNLCHFWIGNDAE